MTPLPTLSDEFAADIVAHPECEALIRKALCRAYTKGWEDALAEKPCTN